MCMNPLPENPEPHNNENPEDSTFVNSDPYDSEDMNLSDDDDDFKYVSFLFQSHV